MIRTKEVHHLPPVEIEVGPYFVVAFLADAKGQPVTKAQLADGLASHIATEMFDHADDALNRFDDLFSHIDGGELDLAFVSCQDQRGESIV